MENGCCELTQSYGTAKRAAAPPAAGHGAERAGQAAGLSLPARKVPHATKAARQGAEAPHSP